jgi:hypothetical protein
MKNEAKSLIFIKASVIALGIVFVVLVAALFILKTKQVKSEKNCQELEVKISTKIQEFKSEENSLTIITEANKSGQIEVIKIDNRSCPKIVNKFIIKSQNN